MSEPIPSLQQYEFNAKSLSAGEVAKTFVAPASAFDRLLTRNNTLLLGPRGSGKTTLLKMLTRKALLNWDELTKEHYGPRVRFHAAFIPADRAWGAQLQAADASAFADPDTTRGEAAFAIQSMIALAVAFREAREHQDMPATLAHLTVALTPTAELELVKSLEASLEVSVPVPTLLGFEIGLRNALMRIGPRGGAATAPFWADSCRLGEAIANCLTVFSSFAQSSTQHWALLFDELEIAPPSIKSALMQNLRGFDQRLVSKLALVPFLKDMPSIEGPISPQVGHDFEVINLSYPHKVDAHEFSRDLAARVFARLNLSASDLTRVLGPSTFQAGRARVSQRFRRERQLTRAGTSACNIASKLYLGFSAQDASSLLVLK